MTNLQRWITENAHDVESVLDWLRQNPTEFGMLIGIARAEQEHKHIAASATGDGQ